MPAIALYGYWRSSSAHRIRIALGLKGLSYDYVPVDLLRGEQAADEYLARSPTAQVPCLTLDGVAYVESAAIVELLDELFPEVPFYPGKAHERARIRTLVEIVNSGVQPLHNRRVVFRVSPDFEVQSVWSAHFIERGLQALERAMASNAREGVVGRYAFGDSPTAADVFIVPQIYAAQRFHVDLAPFPRVRGAFESALQLDAVQLAAPERQPDAPKG